MYVTWSIGNRQTVLSKHTRGKTRYGTLETKVHSSRQLSRKYNHLINGSNSCKKNIS